MKLFLKPIVLLILVALVLRLLAAFWSLNYRENTDILRYKDWARISFLYGFPEVYKTNYLSFGTLASNQPPGSLYILSTFYQLSIQAAKVVNKISNKKPGDLQWVNIQLQTIFLRLPSILSDLIIGYIIFLTILSFKKNDKQALLGASLFLFNPVVIYNSAFWGQMDSINNLFIILSVYFLMKHKPFFVIPLIFASLYIKLSLFPLLPILLFVTLVTLKEQFNKILLSLVGSMAFILLLTVPISQTPHLWIYEFIKSSGLGEMQNITSFAFNFWWVIFKPNIIIGSPTSLFNFSEVKLLGSPADSSKFFFLSLFQIGIIMYSAAILPLFYQIYKNRNCLIKPEMIMIIFLVSTLLIFLFLPRMHERYIFPAFVLFAIYYGLTKKYLIAYVCISIVSFLNLYIVWHPMSLPFLTYDLIKNVEFQWSLAIIMVVTILFVYIKSLKTLMNDD